MLIAIDSHVHLHRSEHLPDILTAARRAFDELAGRSALGVLMLSEMAGVDMFDALRPFTLPTAEPEARWADAGRRLLIVAGRQIVTAERLEVLALATTEKLPDGRSADLVVEQLAGSGAIIVLPWSVGKWLGRRGHMVSALRARWGDRLFVGDIGGRPRFWPLGRPARGAAILAGSDPLPIPGSERHIGRFGSLLEGTLDPDRPVASLRALLATQRPRRFGGHAGPSRFAAEQIRLRLKR